MIPVLTLLAIVAVIGLLLYNRLVSLVVQVDNAWSDIAVQLKRRHDLVPNLVETVAGYAKHERESLEAVVQARNAAVLPQSPAQQQRAEQSLAASLGQLFALAEAYPELRAVERFNALQGDLGEIEDALQSSRRYYNAVVRDLNTALVQFPSNVLASLCAIRPREFFELTEPSEAAAPRVSFGG